MAYALKAVYNWFIKIALFSAIVATLFVQSLGGLSQDPSARTNELLQNLTEIAILISRTNVSALEITQPVPFAPQPSDIRLNFYWSVSLVLSVSYPLTYHIETRTGLTGGPDFYCRSCRDQ